MKEGYSKILQLIVILSIIMSCFLGCNSKSGLAKDAFINQIKSDTDNNEYVGFEVRLLAQPIFLSWYYSIDFRIENNNIYLNDVLYDSVELIDNLGITYDAKTLKAIDDSYDDEYVTQILEKVVNSDSCYILKTKNDSKIGNEIAVYKVDGCYIFLSFYSNSNEVLRIHHFNVK